jgi:phosphoenolpyruvate synthase/pyruvate phosphate dikinase
MSTDQNQRFLTLQEYAALTRRHYGTVRREAAEGRIPTVQFARRGPRYVPQEYIEQLVESSLKNWASRPQ